MSDDPLDRELALQLLRKLSDDEDFRLLYSKSPPAALKTLGFPADVIGKIPPGPVKLGPEPLFQQALYQVIDNVAQVYYCQKPPTVKLVVGEASGSTVKDPFAGS